MGRCKSESDAPLADNDRCVVGEQHCCHNSTFTHILYLATGLGGVKYMLVTLKYAVVY